MNEVCPLVFVAGPVHTEYFQDLVQTYNIRLAHDLRRAVRVMIVGFGSHDGKHAQLIERQIAEARRKKITVCIRKGSRFEVMAQRDDLICTHLNEVLKCKNFAESEKYAYSL